MNLMTVEHLTKSYTEKQLLEDVSFGIQEGDKIGLIGINGTGKSTLLRILAGVEEADQGTVTRGNRVRVAYLPQNPVFDVRKTILENVIDGKSAEKENWNLEGEARAMLLRFGIDNPDGRPDILSGGQRKRAALVKVLLGEAELLILDEPTNHLDSEMAEWLEEYLKKRKSALFMITHDRYFLDQVTNRILELDHASIYSYTGGYSKFLELKAQRAEMELATERKRAALYRQDLEWIQRGARARSTKQKAHIARFEELKNREKPREESVVEMGSVTSRLGRSILDIKELGKAYGDKVLFHDFTYTFVKQERLGIIGHNGCGKTTLLRMLCGQEQPDFGTIETGQTVKIGYFSQESGELNPKQKVLDSVKDIAEYVETTEGPVSAGKMLERFLFEGGMQHTLIEKLSGGERRRLALLHVLMSAPNVLILDEPTNDLDIQTLSILEDYLDQFTGIVITVSHDRYFLDRVVNRILAFEQGEIKQYEGGYSDYLARYQAEHGAAPGKASIGSLGGSAGAGLAESKTNGEKESDRENGSTEKSTQGWKTGRENKLKFTYAEQKEYETIDADIAALEEKIAAKEQEITENAASYMRLGELTGQKEELERALAEKMDRWVYLSELAEQIEQAKNK